MWYVFEHEGRLRLANKADLLCGSRPIPGVRVYSSASFVKACKVKDGIG